MSNPVCFLHNPPTRGARVRVACAAGVWACGACGVRWAVCGVRHIPQTAAHTTHSVPSRRPRQPSHPPTPRFPSHSADRTNQTTHSVPFRRPRLPNHPHYANPSALRHAHTPVSVPRCGCISQPTTAPPTHTTSPTQKRRPRIPHNRRLQRIQRTRARHLTRASLPPIP